MNNNKLDYFKLLMLTIIAISTGYIALNLDNLLNALHLISSALQAMT